MFSSATALPQEAPGPTSAAHSFPITLESGVVTRLHYGPEARVPYFWPILGPGNVEMTRAFPMETSRPGEAHDHPHHRSLWFAHGDVNGHDFWHGGERQAGDGKAYPRIDLEHAPLTYGNLAGIHDSDTTIAVWTEIWRASGDQDLLKSKCTLTATGSGTGRTLVYQTKLTALTDVTFGDTKEGTFAIRLRPELRLRGEVAQGKARGADGAEDGKLWGKRNRWLTYYGPVGDRILGVAVFDHVQNLRHPTWWHARDYGLVGANPFGVHDFERKPKGTGDFNLPKGESLELRYRIEIFEGEPDLNGLESTWRTWTEPKKNRPSKDAAAAPPGDDKKD